MRVVEGGMRLADLSSNTPAVDVCLSSLSDPHATLVLHHVPYGTVSPYLKVAPGEYTVAMRGAGAPTSSLPGLYTTGPVTAGGGHTVAGLGPARGLELPGVPARATTAKGEKLLRGH